MNKAIQTYNASLPQGFNSIVKLLSAEISENLPKAESKIWHGHPVWFLDDNPIVGYSKLKDCIRLLFWSGQLFEEPGLQAEGNFKAAAARYTTPDQINVKNLKRWLQNQKTFNGIIRTLSSVKACWKG